MDLEQLKIKDETIDILKSRDLISVEALLRKEPLHYYDFSEPISLSFSDQIMEYVKNEKEVCIIGKCKHVSKTFKNRKSIIKLRVEEQNSKVILFITILGKYEMYDTYQSYLNKNIIVGGFLQYSEEYKSFSMFNPILLSDDIESNQRIHIIYGTIKGIENDELQKLIHKGIEKIGDLDFLPTTTLKRYFLPSFKESAWFMHYPKSMNQVILSRKRAVFEDLLYLAIKLELQGKYSLTGRGLNMQNTVLLDSYLKQLPYSLTIDQNNAIKELVEKAKTEKTINALIQGDVGTGKTVVAIAMLFLAVSNGFQATLMAPYTTLAEQHYKEIKMTADKLGLNVVLLTSDCTPTQKKKIYQMINDGKANIVVGTQSVFNESINYKNLGMIIIDEEHKFGVVHRERLKDKGLAGVHKITMSATPIPKTLASTIYGENVEVLNIISKPEGRIPIQTAVCKNDITVLNFMLTEIQKGHQAYVVCPSIDKNATSVIEKEAIYRTFFEQKGIKTGIITGRTKNKDKKVIMDAFRNNEIQVLIATTVIEVGINVPNATCIVIVGADRFGFSTLHQLRGRVGRGNCKSYCILQTDNSNEKLEFLCKETNGYNIALKDLELRGPGSLYGDRQSGNDYYVKLMLTYPNMYKKVKEIAKELCKNNTGQDMIERYEKLFIAENES